MYFYYFLLLLNLANFIMNSVLSCCLVVKIRSYSIVLLVFVLPSCCPEIVYPAPAPHLKSLVVAAARFIALPKFLVDHACMLLLIQLENTNQRNCRRATNISLK